MLSDECCPLNGCIANDEADEFGVLGIGSHSLALLSPLEETGAARPVWENGSCGSGAVRDTKLPWGVVCGLNIGAESWYSLVCV